MSTEKADVSAEGGIKNTVNNNEGYISFLDDLLSIIEVKLKDFKAPATE